MAEREGVAVKASEPIIETPWEREQVDALDVAAWRRLIEGNMSDDFPRELFRSGIAAILTVLFVVGVGYALNWLAR